MRQRLLPIFFVCFGVWAQTPTTPRAATVLDGSGNLVTISGVLGTLLPGIPLRIGTGAAGDGPIRSAAFGAANGAVKTDSQVIITDAAGVILSRTSTPAVGPALWGFAANGTVQWMYVAGSPQIQSLTGAPSVSSSGSGDQLIALGPSSGNGLQILARAGTQLWAETIDVVSGTITAQTPVPGSAPAAAFEGEWLVTSGPGLLWVAPSPQVSLTIPALAPILSLQMAGPHAVAVNGKWLLNRAWKLLEIPSAPRAVPRTGIAPREGVRN